MFFWISLAQLLVSAAKERYSQRTRRWLTCQPDKDVEAVFAVWLPFQCFWIKIYRRLWLRCISRFVTRNPLKIAPLESRWFVDIETKTIWMISIIFHGDMRWSNNSPWFWIENERITLTTKRTMISESQHSHQCGCPTVIFIWKRNVK